MSPLLAQHGNSLKPSAGRCSIMLSYLSVDHEVEGTAEPTFTLCPISLIVNSPFFVELLKPLRTDFRTPKGSFDDVEELITQLGS